MVTALSVETFNIRLFWGSLVNFEALLINKQFKNQKKTIFAKPSEAQTKTTNRFFDKSKKYVLRRGKKHRKREMVMNHRFW